MNYKNKQFKAALSDFGIEPSEFANAIGISEKSMYVMTVDSADTPKWAKAVLLMQEAAIKQMALCLKEYNSNLAAGMPDKLVDIYFKLKDTEEDEEAEDELLSCCGDELDPDVMICPTCKEHC